MKSTAFDRAILEKLIAADDARMFKTSPYLDLFGIQAVLPVRRGDSISYESELYGQSTAIWPCGVYRQTLVDREAIEVVKGVPAFRVAAWAIAQYSPGESYSNHRYYASLALLVDHFLNPMPVEIADTSEDL
jgi:hypothetical protein